MVIMLFFRNFAQKFSMQKRILYIFSLWIATMSILLSTVMTHHHHMGRICMVEEQCEQDGNINDEHTEHHDQENEGDRENCSVRQMHQFVVSSKVTKSIKEFSSDDALQSFSALFLHDSYEFIPCHSLTTVRWQHIAANPLSDGLSAGYSRRGPPSFIVFG